MAGSMYFGTIFEEAAHISPQSCPAPNPAAPSASPPPLPARAPLAMNNPGTPTPLAPSQHNHQPTDSPQTMPVSSSNPLPSPDSPSTPLPSNAPVKQEDTHAILHRPPPPPAHHPDVVDDITPSLEGPVSASYAPSSATNDDDHDDHDHDADHDDDDDDDDDEITHVPAPGQTGTRKRRKAELHRRHSKRYRDNLGELFNSLEDLLPKVVPGCKLKTKNQIIASSVQAVKRLRTEVASLEMQYVNSNAANRTKWVEDIVQRANTFSEAAEPFMRLLVGIQRWKHSELWSRFEVALRPDGTDAGRPVDQPTNSVHNLGPDSSQKFYLKLVRTASAQDLASSMIPESYSRFSKLSQLHTFRAGDDSLVGRTANSLSSEWLDLSDPESYAGFRRVDLARQCGFRLCFGVPILVRGHVFGTVLFFDDRQRSDLQQDIGIAQDLASCLGNCFGASTMKSDLRMNVVIKS